MYHRLQRDAYILFLGFIVIIVLLVAPVSAAVTVSSVTQSKYNVSEQAGTVVIVFNIAADVVADGDPLTVDFENYKTISGNPVATLKDKDNGDVLTYFVTSEGATAKTLTFNITQDAGGAGMAAANSPYTLTITGGANIVNPTTAGNDVTITMRTAVPESGTKETTIKPVVTSINPSNRGSGSTTTSYVITGDGFTNGGVLAAGVTIGTATSTAVVFGSITTITATVDVSAQAVGTKNVVVTNNGATNTGTNIFDINVKPTFTSAATNAAGTNITITFSKAMANPAGKHAQFTYSINGGAGQAFDTASLNTGDTTQIFLRTSGTAIAGDNAVTVSYTAGDVIAGDTGTLATFTNQAVTNNIAPPTVASAATNAAGTNITITFSKAMANPAGKHAQFTYSIDGGAAQAFDAVSLNTGDTTQIFLRMAGATITTDSVVTVSYTAGDVKSADTGVLATFVNQAVNNGISVPVPPPHTDNAASGGPAPVAPATTSTTDVNVGGDSAVSQVAVTGTGVNDIIVTSTVVSGPGEGNAAPSGGPVYEYMDITAARYTTISEAVMTFTVPVSWLNENHVGPENIVMNHQEGKNMDCTGYNIRKNSGWKRAIHGKNHQVLAVCNHSSTTIPGKRNGHETGFQCPDLWRYGNSRYHTGPYRHNGSFHADKHGRDSTHVH
jgi:uncharacterized repeat protein (TIGR02059 family)